MNVISMHHLAVPCVVEIKKADNSLCQKDERYYVNPLAIFRYEPGGAVITPPMLYSSFLQVDEESVNLLRERVFFSKGVPNHMLEILLENDVISKRQFLQQDFLEVYARISNLPTQVLFEITSFCNCDCMACYHKSDLENYVPPLEHLLRRVDKLKELGIGLFEVTGGEPFSRSDLDKILFHIQNSGAHFYVVTNGEYLLDSSRRLLSVLKSGLGVAVSLDGVGEIHNQIRRRSGLYDKMLRGVDLLYSNGIKIYFISTLNHINVECVGEMVGIAKRYNTTVHFRPAIMTGAAVLNNLKQVDLASKLKPWLKNPNVRNGLLNTKKVIYPARYYGCGIRKRISVDSRGVLYPCVMNRSNPLGNIENFTQSSIVEELSATTKKFLAGNEKCYECKHNKESLNCGGFCRFSNSYKEHKEE
jgi:radical SAM protein with 4Fe4S-binding SPASM domain